MTYSTLSSNLPASLRVGPFRVRVKARPALEMDANEATGRYHGESNLIELRDDLPERVMQDTLLHEALHAALWCHGLRVALEMSKDDEERLVSGLTPALLALLRDNPTLVWALTR